MGEGEPPPIAVDEGHISHFRSVLSNSSSNFNLSSGYDFKFGFSGELKIEIVGADVPDGPMPIREDLLSGKDICGASRTSPPTFG